MDKNFVESWVGTLGTLPRMTAFTVPESGLVDGLEQARRTLLASVLVFLLRRDSLFQQTTMLQSGVAGVHRRFVPTRA